MKRKRPLEDPDFLGPELARAYRHIEWLVARGMGSNSDSAGIRWNAREFVERDIVASVLTRWPTDHKSKQPDKAE